MNIKSNRTIEISWSFPLSNKSHLIWKSWLNNEILLLFFSSCHATMMFSWNEGWKKENEFSSYEFLALSFSSPSLSLSLSLHLALSISLVCLALTSVFWKFFLFLIISWVLLNNSVLWCNWSRVRIEVKRKRSLKENLMPLEQFH